MRTITLNDLKDRWERIEARNNAFVRVPIDHPLEFQMGRGASGFKSLIVENTGNLNCTDIPSSAAVRAENVQMKNGIWNFEIQLIQTDYEEEFLRLCWDLIDSTRNSRRPLQDLIKRYMNWQKFLQYAKSDIMSFSRQKGLLGELLYLKNCLESIDAESAVNAWVGAEGSDQDFQFADSWTEVKAVALAADSVKISSLEQLDQEKPGILKIYILETTAEEEGTVSLPDTVSGIRSMLSGQPVCLDRFEIKLYKYGYRKKDEDSYSKNRFQIRGNREYFVDNEFPKFTRRNTDPAIESASYSLSLAGIEKYRR